MDGDSEMILQNLPTEMKENHIIPIGIQPSIK